MSESFDFEGDEVSNFTAQIPAASLDASQAYPRGTLLTLNLQVRVKSVRLEEDRKGNLTRKHVLALEDASIMDVLTPAQRKALIEAAEAEANAGVQPAAADTISEEQHIEDLLPEERAAEQKYDDVPTDDDRLDPPAPLPGEPVWDGDTKLTTPPIAPRPITSDDDDDHAWMDEEDQLATGLRVEVGF